MMKRTYKLKGMETKLMNRKEVFRHRKTESHDLRQARLTIAEAQDRINGTLTPELRRAYDDAQKELSVLVMRAKPGWHVLPRKKERETEGEKRRRQLMYGR